MKHRMISAITLLTLLIASAGCSTPGLPETVPSNSQNVPDKPFTTASDTDAETAAETTVTSTAVPAETTEVQTETESVGLYDYILTRLAAHENVIRFSNQISNKAMDQAIKQIVNEHPELFWIKQWSCTSTPSWSKLEIETEYSADELLNMSNQLDAAMQDIINQVPADRDAYGKALFVHDFLVTHTDYDEEAAADEETLNGTSAYDCLVGHRAVCSGYSSAYQMIMKQLGFDCGVCCGMSRGTKHAWNYVQIDGKYYWVDVTFDDPISSDGGGSDPDSIRHSYFLINDEMLLRSRDMDADNPFVPVCDSLDQNYYVRNNSYLDAYSAEGVNAIVARAGENRQAEIMFGTSDALHEAITDLMENEAIWDLEAVQANGWTDLHYQSDTEMHVLSLFF